MSEDNTAASEFVASQAESAGSDLSEADEKALLTNSIIPTKDEVAEELETEAGQVEVELDREVVEYDTLEVPKKLATAAYRIKQHLESVGVSEADVVFIYEKGEVVQVSIYAE